MGALRQRFRVHFDNEEELLWRRCNEAAAHIYGKPLPYEVSGRLDRELSQIIGNGYANEYLIGAGIAEKAKETGGLVTTRGKLGSSLVAYLCGMTTINPLPAHYVCRDCRCFLAVKDDHHWIHGYDLPEKECPKCKRKMKSDGADIPAEIHMGLFYDREPDIILNVGAKSYPDILEYLQTAYGQDRVVRAGISKMDRKGEGIHSVHPGGLYIIPEHADITQYTELRDADTTNKNRLKITDCDHTELEPTFKKYDIFKSVLLDLLRDLERETGVDHHEVMAEQEKIIKLFLKEGISFRPKLAENENMDDIKEIIQAADPKCFSDMVRIYGLRMADGAWKKNTEDLIRDGYKLCDIITCRDDILAFLIESGIDTVGAYTIMSSINKGKGLTQEDKEYLTWMSIPLWYIDSLHKIKYLYPRSQLVEYAYIDFVLGGYKVCFPEKYYEVCNHYLKV